MSAIFKRPGNEEGIKMPLKEAVTREMLCAMFGLNERKLLRIFNANGEEEAVLHVLDDSFTPQTHGIYTVKIDSDLLLEKYYKHKKMSANECLAKKLENILKQELKEENRKIFLDLLPHLYLQVLNKFSPKSFTLLALTCRDMFPLLQTNDIVKKVAPWVLDIIKHPSDHREFAFSLSRRNAKYYDIERTIQGKQLDDMKHFIIHGVRAVEGTPQRCLFDGCHEIQRKQVAFSTFFSMYNRLPDVVEMLKILKPKRAEIWLVKFDERHQILTEYGQQLMSREWAFEDAGEELKVVTGSFDYLKDMNTMVYFIFQLKIFQAFSLRPLAFPIVARFLRGIHIDPKLGKLQLIQFLFREQNNQNVEIFDGIPLLFKEEHEQSMQEMCCTGVAEYGPRILAGIVSKNGERVAIVVSRKYFKFRVVTIGFATFEGYKEELGRIYKDIEELQLTVETTFKKKMFNE